MLPERKGVMEEIAELAQVWAEAEQRGDAGALEGLLTGDFLGVGPLGFVLDRVQWLDRYRLGHLSHRALAWEPQSQQRYGDCVRVVGRLVQQARYRGQPSDGQFRGSQLWVQQAGRWQLAGMQLSPIAQPPVSQPPTAQPPAAREG